MNFLHVLDGHLSGLLIRLIRGTLVWIQNKRDSVLRNKKNEANAVRYVRNVLLNCK